MSNQVGYYFPARHTLTLGIDADVIRAAFGHKGIDQYVSLLCYLVDTGGEYNIAGPRAEALARRLWCEGVAELHTLLGTLAELEIIDAAQLEQDVVYCPEVADAVRILQTTREQKSEAGRKGAEKRWAKND